MSPSGRRTARIYLPLGAAGLGALARDGQVRAPSYAVTAAARSADPEADEEDLEYEAMCAAARDPAARRLPGDAGAVGRVVVAAGDVDEAVVTEDTSAASRYAVRLAAPVTLAQVVSVHVQEAGSDDETELLWYDVSELGEVVQELTATE